MIFAGLAVLGVTKPFVGTNAADLFFPIADRLVNEHRFNGLDSWQDSKVAPAYPFLIAALKVARLPAVPVVVVLLQIMADAVTALCLLWLGGLLGQVAAGGIAGLVWSIYPPAFLISTWITPEPIFTTLFIGSIVLVLSSISSNKPLLGASFGAGLLIGLATLFRATPILIWVFLIPAWFSRRRFLDGLVYVAGMVLLIAPWIIRNTVVLHDRIAVSTGTGNVLLLGSEEEQITASEKKEPFYVAAAKDGERHGIFKPNPEYGSAIDRWYTRIALMRYRRLLQSNPLGFTRLFVVKFLRLWYATDTATPRPQLALALCSLPIVPLGLWQVWKWRKTRTLLFLVSGGVLLYFIAMHLATLPMLRYTIPIYPILILAVCQWLLQRFAAVSSPEMAIASHGVR